MALANITVSITEPAINVSSDASNVTVTNTTSNITVSNVAVVSNATILAALSAEAPIDLASNGQISINNIPNSKLTNSTITLNDQVLNLGDTTTLAKLTDIGVNDTDVNAAFLGFRTGNFNTQTDVGLIQGAGNIQIKNGQASGDFTKFIGETLFNDTVNLSSGAVLETTNNVVLSGGNVYLSLRGGANIDGVSTNSISEGTNLYLNGAGTTDNLTEGSTNLFYTDVRSRAAVSVTQATASGAGTLDYSSVSGVFTYTPPDLTAFGLTNAQAQAFIQTNGLAMTSAITSDSNITTTANISAVHGTFTGATGITVTGNASIGGNLNVTGNINSETVVDLFVEDRNVTLQYGQVGAPSANSQIFVDRGSSANTYVLWDEGVDAWKFSNDGSTDYLMATSTSDLAEGTNLYYTDARSRGAVSVTTTTPSGNGALAYDNTSGVFTFTPVENATISPQANAVLVEEDIAESLDKYITFVDNTWTDGDYEPLLVKSDKLTFTTSQGNLSISGKLTAGSNASATAISANGNIIASGEIITSNYIQAQNNITTIQGNITTSSGNIVGQYLHGDGSNITGIAQLSAFSVTTTAASGDGALAYDNTSGVFTFTPADSEASEYGDSNVITLFGNYGNAISSNANISTTGFFEGDTVNGAMLTKVYNASGSTIANNSVVYYTGGSGAGGVSLIGLASAANANYMPAVGITTSAIADSSSGYIITQGQLGHDFGGSNSGTEYFVSATTPGGVVHTEQPYGESNVVQVIGRSNSSGTTLVEIGEPFGRLWFNFDVAGGRERISGVPNLNEGNIFLGNIDDQVFPAVLNTSIVPESGSNEYFTTARANTAIDNYTGAFANAQINTTQNITTTGNLNVSTINSTAGTDLVLDPNTKNIAIKKTLSGASTTQLTFANEGWAPSSFLTQPVYNGASVGSNIVLVAWVIEGTTTAGSNVISVTTATEFQDAFGTGNYNGNAPTAGGRTTALGGGDGVLGPNMLARGNGALTNGAYPFPNGAKIQTIDSSANTITMDVPANETATLSWNGGGTDTKVLFFSGGVYGNTSVNQQYAESFYSKYDFKQIGYASNPAKDELAFAEIAAQDEYGFGQSGPVGTGVDDIFFTNGLTNDYTQGTYRTRGRIGLEGNKSFIQTNFGMSVGANSSVTNRINNDQFSSFGYTQLWDGTENYASDFGVTTAIPQIGTKQYTDGSAQATQPYLGTRLQFNSAYGQITDNPQEWYPRTGQELGRMGWWGSHGDLENPSSAAAPAYISVQAADNWTNGSNASMYFVATSDYSKTYREPFISYEKGNLILAGGNVAGVTQNITFAPAKRAQGSGADPAGTYDFVGGPNSSQAFGTVNYADTSANSGAEIKINNGGSLGAGTVGDMKMSIHRKDNSYALANTSVTITGFFTAATISSYSGGAFNTDTVGVSTGSGALPRGVPVTFSGITNSNWTYLNGNTYVLAASIGFLGAGYSGITQVSGGGNVQQGGADVEPLSGGGVYEYANSQASGVTDKEWSLTLAEQSEDLVLKGNTTTQVTFTDSRTTLNSSLKLKSYTTAEVNALASPQAGDTVFCTDASGGATIVFYNGSAWQKVSHANL